MTGKAPQWFAKLYPLEISELLDHFEVADEEKFCDVFMGCKNRQLRRNAVRMIEDQDRLWYYATNDPDADVRAAAAERLTDDERSVIIAYNDEDRRVRTAAAGHLTDRELLYHLATAHPDRWVRKAAIKNMDDDSDLMMIVFSETEENELRLNAAQMIDDEECLKMIINSRERLSQMDHHNAIRDSRDVRRTAVWKTADHELLRSLAADYCEQCLVRIAALRRLGENDQDVLEKIAATPFDPDPRRDPDLYYEPELKAAAVSGLTDKDLLRSYLDDFDKETRAEARIALGDENLLKDTVEDPYWPFEVRKRALEKITDQDFIYKFAKSHICSDPEETKIASAAAKMVQDPARLAEIAMGAYDYKISEAAAACLHDDEQILRILTEIEDHPEKWAFSIGPELQYVWEQELKRTAACNLEDLKPLVRLALDDPGDHYDINNFKEYSIGLLCSEPELLLEYVNSETDEYALSLAANFTVDETVLQAIADKGLKDTYSLYKLNNLRRIGEVGLRKKSGVVL